MSQCPKLNRDLNTNTDIHYPWYALRQ